MSANNANNAMNANNTNGRLENRYIAMFRNYWYNNEALSPEELKEMEDDIILPVIQDFLYQYYEIRFTHYQPALFFFSLKDADHSLTLKMRYFVAVQCSEKLDAPILDSFSQEELEEIEKKGYGDGWGGLKEDNLNIWAVRIWGFAQRVLKEDEMVRLERDLGFEIGSPRN